MIVDRARRRKLAGRLSVAWLSCAVATVLCQAAFVDDAKRTVSLPASVNRVFAAGAPAEVLLYTLAPDRLAGRNRVPEGPAIEFFPPAFRNPVFIRQLPEVDNPAADAELVALKPDVYVDYGMPMLPRDADSTTRSRPTSRASTGTFITWI